MIFFAMLLPYADALPLREAIRAPPMAMLSWPRALDASSADARQRYAPQARALPLLFRC